jgi:hypothetical protein
MNDVVALRMEQKLEYCFGKTLPKLSPAAQAQLKAIMNPTALGIIAGVLVAWVVSHA